MTITNIDGKTVKVTDLDAAIKQAQMYVSMHENAKENQDQDGLIYYKDAHAEWAHDLKELLKLKKAENGNNM